MSLYMYLDTGEKFYLECTWGRKAGGSRSRPCIHTRRGVSTRTWTRSDKKLNTALWWGYSGKWPLRCWGRPVWYTSHQLQTTQKNHVRADTEQKKVLYHMMTILNHKMHTFSDSNLYISSIFKFVFAFIVSHNASLHWLTIHKYSMFTFFHAKGS